MAFCWNGAGWGSWGGIGIIGPILGLVLSAGSLALLGVGSFWLVRQVSRRLEPYKATVTPLEIAQQRRARGEISADEFEEIRTQLQS